MASEVVSLWRQREQTESFGREAELSLLLRDHDDAKSADRSRFVFVKGPAGVGKSHLFGLLRTAGARRNAPVFEGGSGRDARRTFGLFTPLLSQLLAHLGQSGVPASRLAELARQLAPITKGTHGAADNRRIELSDAACELFSLAGREAPLFLFPDLDVADRASLELFRYLAAVVTTPGARGGGLFVASLRDDGTLASPLVEVLSKVPARSLPLSGLDVEGIRAYLSRHDIAQKLLEATGGNPEALERLLEQQSPTPVDFFVRRAERLDAAQRSVLDTLAVSRDALGLSVLRSHGDVAQHLDVLVRERFLLARVVDGQPVYRFARDAERHAWLSAMDADRRSHLSRDVGLLLAETGDVVAAAAMLLTLGRDAQTAKFAVRAGDELAGRGANEDAAELYAQALESLSGAERSSVLERMAQVLAAQGSLQSAARALLESHRLAQAPAKVLTAARHLVRAGRLKLAELCLRVPLEDGSTRDEAEAVRAEIVLVRGQPARAVELCRKALQREPEVSLNAAIALRNLMGRAHLAMGDARAAAELFAENAQAAEGAGLKDLAAQAKLNRGVAAQKLNDRETAIACYQAAHSHGLGRHWALANLGSLYAESGDFEAALDALTRALQLVTRHGGPKETAHVASNLSRLHHFLGDFERAAELSEHALTLASQIDDLYLEGSALMNLGAVALDKKDAAEAARSLDAARLKLEAVGNDGYAALSCALKARSHLLMGERAQAEQELSRRCVEKGAASLSAATIEVELVRGELCLQLNDLLGAGRAAARAKDALLASPDLEGPFRVYFLMGKLRAAANDASGAQAELSRAWRMLEELSQRVPPVRRSSFLSVPRRAELIAAVEPELKLPRSVVAQVPEKKLGLVGRSAALQRIVRQLEPIGKSNTTVLIRGESGTGKELLADALHQLSPRRGMPLVKVNCAAMVEELLLSELFGHEKGAFTGAIRERKGRFELADGGTLFLDEIGDISPKCQVALLRVLQERELERVGGTKTIKVDVRVICATNRDLESLIAQGRFRADLYYRLKGVMLELPSLRERPEDLPSLCAHFLERVAKERGESVKRLSEESIALLRRHDWPGNVRELENVLSAAAIFAEGDLIGPDAFSHVAELRALLEPRPAGAEVIPPAPLAPAVSVVPPAGAVALAPVSPVRITPAADVASVNAAVPAGPVDWFGLARQRDISLKDLRHEVEMQCIRRALVEAKGNISEAARLLKMKRSRLSQIVNAEGELKGVAHGDDEE
jgi:transcriptional regulator with GAF, ATPase, and Fis domain